MKQLLNRIKNYERTTAFANEGTDPRIEGLLGEGLARAQRATIMYSTNDPKTASLPIGSGHLAVSWPPFFSAFIPRGGARYFSFRIGLRHDPNLGDGNNPKEPPHDPPGGYFFDVISKPNIDHVVKQ